MISQPDFIAQTFRILSEFWIKNKATELPEKCESKHEDDRIRVILIRSMITMNNSFWHGMGDVQKNCSYDVLNE